MEEHDNDQDLLLQISLDDASAFEVIYKRYSKSLFVYALNIFKNREICEDIVQNVFIDLWSRRKVVEISKLKSYLFQSVRFQVFKQKRDMKISSEDVARLALLDLSLDVSRKLEFEEFEALLKEKLAQLPPTCQKIFVMSRFDEKSNKEIASELHISVQAVKNQIGKALKMLRQELLTPPINR
jgi:RNA polymerase sigma-70 factor (family 1)